MEFKKKIHKVNFSLKKYELRIFIMWCNLFIDFSLYNKALTIHQKWIIDRISPKVIQIYSFQFRHAAHSIQSSTTIMQYYQSLYHFSTYRKSSASVLHLLWWHLTQKGPRQMIYTAMKKMSTQIRSETVHVNI